jgi:hypothetical protein
MKHQIIVEQKTRITINFLIILKRKTIDIPKNVAIIGQDCRLIIPRVEAINNSKK